MLDVTTLTAVAVAALPPYLVELGKGAAQEVGKRAVDGTKGLYAWLRSNLSGSGASALGDLAADPADEDLQAVLRVQLRKHLAAQPAQIAELAQLIEALPSTASQHLEQHGDHNRGAQVQGDGNSVDVS